MMKEKSMKDSSTLPVSFRVFGIGKKLTPIIEKISLMDYDGMSAVMIDKDRRLPVPSDEDKMVILLVDDNEDLAMAVALSFYQADVLTLTVSTQYIDCGYRFCDAQSVCLPETMYLSVKTFLDILFGNGYICMDYNDILYAFRNSDYFRVFEANSSGSEQRVAETISKISGMVSEKEMSSVENVLISIFFNKEMQPALNMSEMKALSDYVSYLPKEVSAVWGVFHDKEMPADEVRMSMIVSGKEMKS